MKSLLPLAAGGAAGAACWVLLPRWVKIPAVVGLVALAAFELNKEANESWFSSAIFGGQAADGQAKIADPVKVRQDMSAGKEVSGAQRNQVVTYEKESAGAEAARAEADAVTASEEELLAKKARGLKLTLAEQVKLKDFEIKRQDLRIKEAEARLKTAQATNAEQTAEVARKSNDLAIKLLNGMNNGTFIETMMDVYGLATNKR